MTEGFEVATTLEIVGTNVTDERADPVDVIGETHDTYDFNEDQAKSLLMIGG